MEINEKIDDREANLQYAQKGITSLSDLEKGKGEEKEKSTEKKLKISNVLKMADEKQFEAGKTSSDSGKKSQGLKIMKQLAGKIEAGTSTDSVNSKSGTEEKILKISNDLKKADEKQLQEVKTSRGFETDTDKKAQGFKTMKQLPGIFEDGTCTALVQSNSGNRGHLSDIGSKIEKKNTTNQTGLALLEENYNTTLSYRVQENMDITKTGKGKIMKQIAGNSKDFSETEAKLDKTKNSEADIGCSALNESEKKNGANNAKVDYENNVLSLLDQDYIVVEGTQNDTIETGIGQDYQKVDESLNSHVEYQSEQRCSMDILNLQESVQDKSLEQTSEIGYSNVDNQSQHAWSLDIFNLQESVQEPILEQSSDIGNISGNGVDDAVLNDELLTEEDIEQFLEEEQQEALKGNNANIDRKLQYKARNSR
ncbi:Os01g0274000 [Oryza sativa Japonica Group]|uniref:Os01g0274000 protein n=1 Tax=Oryza sativa subsp. japonica TaxID=39947 RepID=A0A0P0V131_ORYSJ|nr:Os01g0274000 [Oryza sativa Japonica Group]